MSVIHKVVIKRLNSHTGDTEFVFMKRENAEAFAAEARAEASEHYPKRSFVTLSTVATDDDHWEHAQALKQPTP